MKKPEVVEWWDLKIGDFIENDQSKLFCYVIEEGSPACLGHNKTIKWKYPKFTSYAFPPSQWTKFKPSKTFVKMCKRLLKLNLKQKYVDNLSYIEALAALKKYD